MTNKYAPKIVCNKCSKEFWNYNEETKSSKCPGCGALVEKRLHPLVGADISKNQDGNYVLKFKEFNEESIYSRWEDLDKKLNGLAKNEVGNNG